MTLEDKFTIEQRTRIIGFSSREKKEYGIIETLGFSDIKYRVSQSKPTDNKLGHLEIAFVVPLTGEVRVIETRFLFNKKGEFIKDRLLSISSQKYDDLWHYGDAFLGGFEHLEFHSKNLNFDYAKICHDKIMELYVELLK